MDPNAPGQSAETLNQPDPAVQTGSEADKTPEQRELEGIKAEMLRERQARQQLEARLKDKDFVYEQAKALGMTDEQAQAQADAVPAAPAAPAPANPAQVQQPQYTVEQIEERVMARFNAQQAARDDYNVQIANHPELLTDPLINAAFSSFVQGGMKYSDAAAKVLSLREQNPPAPAAPAAPSTETVAGKAAASTASGTGTSTAQAVETADVERRAKSFDRQTQEQAYLELMAQGKL